MIAMQPLDAVEFARHVLSGGLVVIWTVIRLSDRARCTVAVRLSALVPVIFIRIMTDSDSDSTSNSKFKDQCQ